LYGFVFAASVGVMIFESRKNRKYKKLGHLGDNVANETAYLPLASPMRIAPIHEEQNISRLSIAASTGMAVLRGCLLWLLRSVA
jgi:hypothetical protein